MDPIREKVVWYWQRFYASLNSIDAIISGFARNQRRRKPGAIFVARRQGF
jgi:hypothetical protein